MFLHELKAIELLREFTDDSSEFASVFSPLRAAAITSAQGTKIDTTGAPPKSDIDQMLLPIIEMAVSSIDPSESIIQSKINQVLKTPALKEKGANGIEDTIRMVKYIRHQFIQDFKDNPMSSTLVKLSGNSSIETYVNKLSTGRIPSEFVPEVKNEISKKKAYLVNALMKRSYADRLHAGTIEQIEKETKSSELSNDKAKERVLHHISAYVVFLHAIQTNLETVQKLIAPDRDIDREDASA